MVYNLKEMSTEIKVDVDENDDTERFTLRLSNSGSLASSSMGGSIEIYKSNTHTVVDFENSETNYQVTVYNALGQKVIATFVHAGGDKLMIDNNKFPSGMNIISITSMTGEVVSEKLTY